MSLPSEPIHYQHFIDGRPVAASSDGRIERRSPGRGARAGIGHDGLPRRDGRAH